MNLGTFSDLIQASRPTPRKARWKHLNLGKRTADLWIKTVLPMAFPDAFWCAQVLGIAITVIQQQHS